MNNGIKIIKTSDPNIIEHILPFMEKLINKNHERYKLETFTKWLRTAISNPLVNIWVAVRQGNKFYADDSGINGYLISTITADIEIEYMNIIHLYSDNKKVTKDLLTTSENWAKKHGIKISAGISKRNPKAWQKAYGYKLNSYNMIKEL